MLYIFSASFLYSISHLGLCGTTSIILSFFPHSYFKTPLFIEDSLFILCKDICINLIVVL